MDRELKIIFLKEVDIMILKRETNVGDYNKYFKDHTCWYLTEEEFASLKKVQESLYEL